MSLLANSNAIESGGYNIDRSLRFRSSASAYLSRTLSGPPSTYTMSMWVKRGKISSDMYLWGSGSYGLFLYANDTLQFYSASSPATTTAVYRDCASWYHILTRVSAGSVTLYVNNVSVATGTASALSTGANEFRIGQIPGYSTAYFDGYLAEVNFIDGQALTPSSFGQTDPVTGVWTPKKYAGTYGTNGSYLPFSDNTSATTLAYDKSGNGNNWTPNNISTTAGATYDSMTDVPTQSIGQGNGSSNYAVLNPLDKGTGATTSNGNLRVDTTSGSPNSQIRASMPITSKAYCEFTVTAASGAGTAFGPAVVNMDVTMDLSNTLSGSYQILLTSNGYIYNPASNSGYTTFAAGDVLGVAYDPTTKYVWFAKNNVWITGNPSTGSGGFTSTDLTSFGSTQTFSWYDGTSSNAQTVDANFGQRPFSYTPPTGFKALNTFNID